MILLPLIARCSNGASQHADNTARPPLSPFLNSANRQFLSVNAFWVRPKEYKWIQRHLAIRVFPGSHTAEATANMIRDIMGAYAIPENAFKYACTDNCSVMTAIFDHHFVDTTRIFCAPHWMQLVIKDALQGKTQEDLLHSLIHI